MLQYLHVPLTAEILGRVQSKFYNTCGCFLLALWLETGNIFAYLLDISLCTERMYNVDFVQTK